MKKVYILTLVLLAIVLGFLAYAKFYKKAEAPTTTGNPLNIAYTIEGQVYNLVNGKAEIATTPGSSSKNIVTIFGEPTYGDLNNDGKQDAGVLLSLNTGGSGTFYYLAAAILKDNEYTSTNAILLGDRIAPQNITIESGKLLANYADRGPKDPMTVKPYIGVTKRTFVSGTELKEMLILKGRIIWGEGVRTFQPCGKDQDSVEPMWIDGKSPALEVIKNTFEKEMAGSGPYSPMYAEIIGSELPAPQDGFGADYKKAISIEELILGNGTGSCKQDLVILENIKPGTYVDTKAPLRLTGKARGNWYFEASFPAQVLDNNGNILASGFVSAQGEWMTTEFVPFAGALIFTKAPTGASGKIILRKDNPSGLPEYDDALEVPIKFK